MSSIRKPKSSYTYSDDYEPPEKKIVSQGDLLIKELAERQAKTNVTLKEQLQQNKEFERSVNYVPITNVLTGKSTLEQFQHASRSSEESEKYQRLGFSPGDIGIISNLDKGDDFILTERRNYQPDILKERIEILRKDIDDYEKKLIGEGKEIASTDRSRQFVEDALSVKPESAETKLLKFALGNKKKGEAIPHPLDYLKQIEQDLFLKEQPINAVQIRRKARKLVNRLSNVEKSSKCTETESRDADSLSKRNSKWDVKIGEVPNGRKQYTCRPRNFFTVTNGQIKKLTPEEVDRKNLDASRQKLTVDEIRRMPKFQNYDVGNPSKKLYIKNLHSRVTEGDLKMICSSCNVKEAVSFQVMEGRMRGQAFVTFSDEAAAARALEELNGLVINNKPMVIQFGRIKESENKA